MTFSHSLKYVSFLVAALGSLQGEISLSICKERHREKQQKTPHPKFGEGFGILPRGEN